MNFFTLACAAVSCAAILCASCRTTAGAGVVARVESESADSAKHADSAKSAPVAGGGVTVLQLEEGGVRMVPGQYLAVQADTSTSMVVDWRGEKKARVRFSRFLANFTERRGIVYKRAVATDGADAGTEFDLTMTVLYHPKARGKFPLVLVVPGGGFVASDPDSSLRNERRYLAQHGFVVASIAYHVVGNGRYTDAVQDVQDALAYLAAHADDYGIDPAHVALMGNSAGGYLVAMAALQNPSLCRAVIDLYGATDLAQVAADYDDATREAHKSPLMSQAMFVNGAQSGLGIFDDPAAARAANPLAAVTADAPPFLFFHGDRDLLVSPSQTLILHEALRAAGVESTRYSLVGADHGSGGFGSKKALSAMLSFLRAHLD